VKGTVKGRFSLSVTDHDRGAAGLTYVYPVLSRRSGGVSVGVNLNPNNACNWHCVYCQVPDLKRGVSPPIDLGLLERELDAFLRSVLDGEFFGPEVPAAGSRIRDVALSGNGEPSSCRSFDAVVGVILDTLCREGLLDQVKIVLISNGSYVHRSEVQRGLAAMAVHRGEVWIKVDAAGVDAIRRINGVSLSLRWLRAQIAIAAAACPTWIQTCMFNWDGRPPPDAEVAAYLDFLGALVRDGVGIHGVLLYGVARPSMQPEAARISPADAAWMQMLRDRIVDVGLKVRLSL
jgi:Fe-S oxidoreductases